VRLWRGIMAWDYGGDYGTGFWRGILAGDIMEGNHCHPL